MKCRMCKTDIANEYFDLTALLIEVLPKKDHKFIDENMIYCTNCTKQFKKIKGHEKKLTRLKRNGKVLLGKIMSIFLGGLK